MAVATHEDKLVQRIGPDAGGPQLTTHSVWRHIESASFAVVGYVTPAGEPRSSGVVYKAVGRRLFVVVAPDSWKARHIAARNHVSVTIPVHRGGVLAFVAPIPPATISFHANAIVHPAGSLEIDAISRDLESLLPEARKNSSVVIELVPEGEFLTYGIGVSLTEMAKPERARARVPVTA